MAGSGDQSTAAGLGDKGKPESQGFNWAAFFRNPYVTLQIILYALMFYKMVPSPRVVGPFLVWMLLLPMSVANVIATHVLMESAAKHGIKLKKPWPTCELEEMFNLWFN